MELEEKSPDVFKHHFDIRETSELSRFRAESNIL